MFSIVDGGIKIICVCDGHGQQGHIVSSAAACLLLDYIRNKNDIFTCKGINTEINEDDMLLEIKKAFKYVQ